MKRMIVAALGLLLATSGANAQAAARPAGPPPSGNGEIRGTVLDAKDTIPLARASIAVRSKRDSSLVTGAIVGANGQFRIQGLRPGAYYLRVTALGYGPRVQDVSSPMPLPP